MAIHDSSKGSAALAAAFTLLALIAIVIAAIVMRPLPMPAPADARANEFSAARALQHVREIAKAPHPTGSVQHAIAGDYLVRTLSAMGLEPFVQQASATGRDRADEFRVTTVRNIAVRKRGSAPTKSVLLVAHYDSAPEAPGAADDGAGVAALMEIMRALQSSAPLKNDVVCLFTDAEEQGLWGARVFLKEHPWAKDVGVVANFEARGSSGPSILFETGDRDAWLARDFARVAPAPTVSSLVNTMSRVPRFQTDLNVFRQAHVPSVNFAFAESWSSYHGATDRPETLDLRSLQHHGSNGLALARYLGNIDLTRTPTDNPIYFNVAGPWVASYSPGLGMALATLAGLAWLWLVATGIRRGHLTLRGVLIGFGGLTAIVIVVALATLGLMQGLAELTEDYASRVPPFMYLYVIAVLCFSGALTAIGYILLLRRWSAANLLVGSSLLFVILAVTTAFFLPGVSFMFLWPVAVTLAATPLVWNASLADWPIARALLFVALAALWIPMVMQPVETINVMFMQAGAFFVSIAAALYLGLLVPSLETMLAPRRWVLPASLTAVTLVILAVALYWTIGGPAPARSEHLFYVANQDTHTAIWATNTRADDEGAAASRVVSSHAQPYSMSDVIPEWYGQPMMRLAHFYADAAPLAAPQSHVSVLQQTTEGSVVTTVLGITSSARALQLALHMVSAGKFLRASIEAPAVTGVASAPETQPVSKTLFDYTKNPTLQACTVRWVALPSSGATLSIATQPVPISRIDLIETSYELPDVPASGAAKNAAAAVTSIVRSSLQVENTAPRIVPAVADVGTSH